MRICPKLLASIAAVAEPEHCRVSVLILDNDSAASAEAIVTNAQATFPYPLAYEHVVQPGLASVRNAALAYARARADVLAMLDDDELPEPQWLCELVRVARATGADAVAGPVTALLPADAPRWVHEFRAREYPAFTDAQRLSDAWTSNCLVLLSRVNAAGLTFDPALNFIGGEDQLFFRQLIAAGGSIAYAANAAVWERLPEDRRSIAFILKRSFRRGSSLAMCDRRLIGTPRGLAIRAAKGLAIILAGLVRIVPVSLLRGNAGAVANSSEIARGAGMLAGLFGVSYNAYRRGA